MSIGRADRVLVLPWLLLGLAAGLGCGRLGFERLPAAGETGPEDGSAADASGNGEPRDGSLSDAAVADGASSCPGGDVSGTCSMQMPDNCSCPCGASCNIACSSSCTVTCAAQSSCFVDCQGGEQCTVDCAQSAECQMSCGFSTCRVEPGLERDLVCTLSSEDCELQQPN
jgi:hypothetical protein